MANGTISLNSNDDDLFIVKGAYENQYTKCPRESALGSFKYILSDLSDIKRVYIRLGFHLDEFERLGYYYDFGYSCLADFAEVNLGMDKTALSRCLNVFREFAHKEIGITSYTRKMWLDDKWQDYSYSQLCEMLPMSPEKRKLVKPDMTISEIRQIKKGNADTSCDVATASSVKHMCNDFDRFDFIQGVVDLLHKQNFDAKSLSYNGNKISFFDDLKRYEFNIDIFEKEGISE